MEAMGGKMYSALSVPEAHTSIYGGRGQEVEVSW